MRIAHITISNYCSPTEYAELSGKLISVFPDLEIPAWPESNPNYHHLTVKRIVTGEEALTLLEKEVKFTVETSRYMDFPSLVKEPAGPAPQASNYNYKVDVHAANGALLFYNSVLLLEDCCTEKLADTLAEGWRILAVCVQPDQRRPDYIMGRYNPALGA